VDAAGGVSEGQVRKIQRIHKYIYTVFLIVALWMKKENSRDRKSVHSKSGLALIGWVSVCPQYIVQYSIQTFYERNFQT
jgi:hypothetical protein